MRGLEYLEDDWQDENTNFERIQHKPKRVKGVDEEGLRKRQEGKIRKESQKVHDLKYGK